MFSASTAADGRRRRRWVLSSWLFRLWHMAGFDRHTCMAGGAWQEFRLGEGTIHLTTLSPGRRVATLAFSEKTRSIINSGPQRTPPSARPSRDGRVPQPARTNCLFTFLILCVPVIAFATSERGVNRVCHEAISCARDSPPNAHDAPCGRRASEFDTKQTVSTNGIHERYPRTVSKRREHKYSLGVHSV